MLDNDFDICCIQVHKLHSQAGLIYPYKNYLLFFGGCSEGYSGTLIAIKSSLEPVQILNHSSGPHPLNGKTKIYSSLQIFMRIILAPKA